MTVSATTAIGGVSRIPSYYRARYYNPTTGRFLSEDPIGFAGSGTNLYSYARNNPLSYRDPSGFSACSAQPDANKMPCQQLHLYIDDLMFQGSMIAILGFLASLAAIFNPAFLAFGLAITAYGLEEMAIAAALQRYVYDPRCE